MKNFIRKHFIILVTISIVALGIFTSVMVYMLTDNIRIALLLLIPFLALNPIILGLYLVKFEEDTKFYIDSAKYLADSAKNLAVGFEVVLQELCDKCGEETVILVASKMGYECAIEDDCLNIFKDGCLYASCKCTEILKS